MEEKDLDKKIRITYGLIKIKSNRNIINWWNEYYCVLENNILYLYKSKNSPTNEDSIDLRDIYSYNADQGKKKKLIFFLFFNRKKNFINTKKKKIFFF